MQTKANIHKDLNKVRIDNVSKYSEYGMKVIILEIINIRSKDKSNS